MVLKDMNVRENFTMDNHHHNPTFTSRRGFMLSFTSLFLLGAFFICSLVAVSFIIYNFATCEQLSPAPGEDIICTTVHLKHGSVKGSDNETIGMPASSDNRTHHKENVTDVRLPRSIKPLKYNITIIPHLTEGHFTFEGEVKIHILIIEDCYNVTMHAYELNISKNEMAIHRVQGNAEVEAGRGLRIRKQYLLEEKQFFVLELYDKLMKGSVYEISLKFNGVLQDYLQGFYRSSYMSGNETRWLASTQFQATDARRAFPCFDEPSLKANFTLNIARPANMSTVSNMPIVATRKATEYNLTNYMWDHFAESLPMSTYLVAFVISDFSHIDKGNFSVWARKDAIQSAKYALDVGSKILKFLEEFFNIYYPLPKINMIALPDFQAGAMENWGLITFRETTMLYDKGISSTINKQRIASVVGHELSHQWFGNLVTPSWWSDIWLNEGFASYMEYLTVDAIEPTWKTMDQFVVTELQSVFQLDSLSTSHQISLEVYDPDEISDIFDRISYSKGATIIRMMSHFLTSHVFRGGLTKYLNEMAYKSADQDDLWRFLTNEAVTSGLLDNSTTVKTIMDTWTLQVGYPMLTVRRHPNAKIIQLEQSRFLSVKNDSKGNDLLWWIPITFTTSNELDFNNTRPITWIPRTKSYEIENTDLYQAEWFIFNIQQTAYYRTNYDLDNWISITKHLMKPKNYKEIAPANRAQVIDDVMNFASGGYIAYDVALNLTRYLIHEDDHVPWKAAINAFNFIDSMLINHGDYDLLRNYLLKLLTFVYDKTGFNFVADEEDMLKLFQQIEILIMACHLGQRNCIAESNRHFQNWIQVPNPDTNNPISPNLRGIVYCSAIEYGTEFEWDFAFERYERTTISSEKELLLTALGCSREPWILSRLLRRSLDGGSIRKQDVFRVFAAVSNNVVGQQITFDFIRSNWREIKTYLGSSMTNLSALLKFATRHMNTKYWLEQFESFVRNELKDNSLSIKQAIEQVQINVDWMERNYKSIIEWLKRETTTQT